MISPNNAFAPFIDGPGLSITVQSGVVLLAAGSTATVPLTAVSLTANATNYVYLNVSTGVIQVSTSAFPAGAYPIATAVTDTASVKTLTDSRADVLAGGATSASTGISLALTNPISSATPASNRTMDSEPSLTAASVAVVGDGSIAAARGNLTISSSTTVTAGYLYGVQGKLTLQGTINVTTGEASAGLVGQLDCSAATAITSVGDSLSMCWLDAGAASAVALTKVSALTITNSIASKPLNAIINIPLADAQFFLVSQDSADSRWSADPGASGKTFQNVGLKVKCNGTTYWLPLYA